MEKHITIWKQALKESFSLNAVIAAAGLAYFALFSFFPLILLIVAIASRWFDPLWVESELITRLDFVIPGISQLLGNNLEKIIEARRSVTTTASLMLLWSGSTLFSMLARTLDSIWNGEDVRPGIRYRGLALLFVGGLSLIALPLLFIGTWVTPLLKGLLPFKNFFFHPNVSLLLSLLFSILLFGLLYRFLPHAGPLWRELRIGAVSAGFLWEIAKKKS
ncbi:MAG: YihY/virulence factor BrkB family protein [Anaerolineae bacterium]|jgi:membrane protein|nr:YihY/virulence factor BrkB family protein [Anaerolineae bacterium]MBT7070439.1 YihY/virulence factor BrkB family protein [Anaerolineae bacterium]MBT7990630.1 YihY/virulence factor BrkB family protein [Anaerolineae bacterium]